MRILLGLALAGLSLAAAHAEKLTIDRVYADPDLSGPRARFGLGGGSTPPSNFSTSSAVPERLVVVMRRFAHDGGVNACVAALAAFSVVVLGIAVTRVSKRLD